MDPTLDACLRSWSLDPWVVLPLVLTALLYVRGYRTLRRRGARRWGPRELACFLGGLAAVFVALASPLETFAGLLLQVHMVQHMLLLMAAPPLLLLGAPEIPLLCGLPEPIRRYWVSPLLREPWLRASWRGLTALPVAWALFAASIWLWHIPALYERPLASSRWHYGEHACFFLTAMLFWWPVVQPYPVRPRWSRWALLPYLFLADVQNTILSAILTFSDRVLYPHYAALPRLGGVSALDDQAAAGVIMWVPGSLAFLLPLAYIGARLLYGRTAARPRSAVPRRLSLPLVVPSRRPQPRDLLRAPLVGTFLKWRHARPALQCVLFVPAVLIVLDGLFGPPVAPMNLAGVLPWVHWRGLLVLVLLVAGNFFCLACPFLLPRTLARRLLPGRRRWPRALRSKWLAVGLLVGFFTGYEVFSLWNSPWWTAWIVVGYFLAAFVTDACFEGAAFCKYVCPVGQFQFVQSLVSPLEVRVRDPAACLRCDTKDCIRGNATALGCELHLYQPRKSGNLDCTFCLDCVHACPHDNIGILATAPGADLMHDRGRSGVGRFARRPDLAALVLVFVFAAFANAAAMVAPVADAVDRVSDRLGLSGPIWVTLAGLVVALTVAPLLAVALATLAGRWWSGAADRPLTLALRFIPALVPLGAGMWLAHYAFHLFAGWGSAVPVVQRAAADVGVTALGTTAWTRSCCAPVGGWVLPLEIVFLDFGLLLSLYAGYRIAVERCPTLPRAWRLFAPWALLMGLVFGVGAWVLFQPMQMRGMMPAGG